MRVSLLIVFIVGCPLPLTLQHQYSIQTVASGQYTSVKIKSVEIKTRFTLLVENIFHPISFSGAYLWQQNVYIYNIISLQRRFIFTLKYLKLVELLQKKLLICNHFYGFRFKCIHVKCHLTLEKLLSFWNEIPFIAWKHMRHLKYAKAWTYVVNNEVNFSFNCDLKYLIDKASFGKSKHITWNKTLSIIVTTTVHIISKAIKHNSALRLYYIVTNKQTYYICLFLNFVKLRGGCGEIYEDTNHKKMGWVIMKLNTTGLLKNNYFVSLWKMHKAMKLNRCIFADKCKYKHFKLLLIELFHFRT